MGQQVMYDYLHPGRRDRYGNGCVGGGGGTYRMNHAYGDGASKPPIICLFEWPDLVGTKGEGGDW